MNRSQRCVANLQYHKPTAKGAKSAKSLMRYLTYREGRDEKARQPAGIERWTDHGMGGSIKEIVERCGDYSSDHVLVFSLVVNPNPQLVAMVEPEAREQFVRELTERTMEGFFEARGIDTGCEYSYVLHHRLSEDPQSPGLHNPHTHVVLPGTIYDEEFGTRVPLYFSQNRHVNHIEMLHEITEQKMGEMMERYVGREWEQRFDALEQTREAERAVVKEAAHGYMPEDDIQWSVWAGTRRTDEQNSAVGYWRYYPDDIDAYNAQQKKEELAPEDLKLEFRPILAGLTPERAAHLASYLEAALHNSPELSLARAAAYGEAMLQLSNQQLEQYHQQQAMEQQRTSEISSWDLSLDL